MSSREQILNKLREGRASRPHIPFPEPDWNESVFPKPEDLLATFVKEFETIAGQAIVAESDAELQSQLKQLLASKGVESVFCVDGAINEVFGAEIALYSDEAKFLEMKASITRCEVLIARTGSIMVSSAHPSGRQLNFFPPIHIVWAKASQLVPFVDDALELMTSRYGDDLPSMVSMITGPSRTADIEKTLVMGAHGPKELIVLINSKA